MDYSKTMNEDDSSEWRTKSRPKTNRRPKLPSPMNHLNPNENESYTEYNREHLDLIKNYVNKRIKVLVIMRGPSGSGKSTLAKRLKPENQGMIISADTFFYNHTTKAYVFDKNKLSDAHLECKFKASNAMKAFVSPVIIDNTNIKIWEFKPYVKLAVQYNYEIEIIEPNTPWKSNINLLCQKNKHNVELQTIRRTLSDYENVDLPKLIDECRVELKKQDESKRPKSSGILSNFGTSNDWSINEDNFQLASGFSEPVRKSSPDRNNGIPSFYLNDMLAVSKSTDITTTTDSEYFDCKSKDTESQFGSNKSEDDDFKSFSLYEPEVSTNDFLTDEMKESLNVLKGMFPDIKEDIIIDFLMKYENDLNMVTNILLDSVNFSSPPAPLSEQVPTLFENITETQKSPMKLFQVKTLQEFCLIEMEKLELAMEDLNSRIQMAKSTAIKKNESSDSSVSSPDSVKKSEIFSRSNSVPKDFMNPECFCNEYKDKKKRKSIDEEPIVFLKINKLKCLVDLFGTPEELEDFDENCEIPIDLELAFNLYQSWKKTRKSRQQKVSITTSDYDSQLDYDEKLSMELFEEINIRDPIEKVPVYLSEKGFNSAQLSLRQIMAEEIAEQKRKEKLINGFNKKSETNLSFYESIRVRKSMEKSSNQVNKSKSNINNGNQSEYIANRIKLKHLYETYENLVDKKMIEEIFKKNNYNLEETKEYINNFYEFNEIKEPTRVFDIKNTKIKKKSPSCSQLVNRYNSVEQDDVDDDYLYDGREMASKYCNLRQSYFEKAAEAHARGWGAVAQYYADLGHQQTKRIEDSNKKAAVQIFKENNPDVNNSNTLDLHGLHVKEAINVLKNIITQKKTELSNQNGRKQKTYIFVITGYGHHSENGPKIRPNVINFLNQTGIRYKEVNIGLLQVHLLNN